MLYPIRYLFVFAFVLAIIGLGLIIQHKKESELKTNETVFGLEFADLPPPNSIDPLDADFVFNMFRARMLFSPPIEVSYDNKLTSSVLKSFNYDKDKKQITFVVREDATFSDGTKLTSDDIVFSIVRMLHTRPLFPVIKEIKGLADWQKLNNRLETYPDGIKVSGNEINIEFLTTVQDPLFRFTLELFSIIPKSSVDIRTNKVLGMPPSSGYYKLLSSDEHGMQFRMWRDPKPYHKINVPRAINFYYPKLDQLKSPNYQLNDTTLLIGHNMYIDTNGLQNLRQVLKIKSLPASLIRLLVLNPNVGPFAQAECRRAFGREMHKILATKKHRGYVVSSSLFPKILPGYRTEAEINSKVTFNESTSCKWDVEIPYPRVQLAGGQFDTTILHETILSIGAKPVPIEIKDKSDIYKKFTSGQIAVAFSGTGFWAQDVLGDLQMMFTPGLHPSLKFVSESNLIRAALKKLDTNEEINLDNNLAEFNFKINHEALAVPVLHTSRYYAAFKDGLMRDLPQAVADPYPWQVFNLP